MTFKWNFFRVLQPAMKRVETVGSANWEEVGLEIGKNSRHNLLSVEETVSTVVDRRTVIEVKRCIVVKTEASYNDA